MITRAEAPEETFAESKCSLCTALCCQYFALEIDAPDEPGDFENLRWYVLHEDTEVFIDGDCWYLQINRRCTWLDGNRCGNYEARPTICAEYSNAECDFDGIEADHVFRTVEELEAYRDEWVAEYERKRSRRRKAAKKAWKARRDKAVKKAAKAERKVKAGSAPKKAVKKATRKLQRARKKVARAEQRLAALG